MARETLYEPSFEHDACGFGFVCDVRGRPSHAVVADAPCRLMICHTPPFDCALDRLVNGTPVGSRSVRTFIERHRPDVAVVGHIHEGRGIDRVGDTTVVNPGALRDGGYVVIDYDEATHRLTPRLERFPRAIVL